MSRPAYGVWKTPRVRLSHFWQLMDDEFGPAYARSLARDHVVGALGNRSPQAALDAGAAPREVWLALCRDMDVPQERWLGKEPPPASAGTGRPGLRSNRVDRCRQSSIACVAWTPGATTR